MCNLIKILGLNVSLILLSTLFQISNKIRILRPDTYHDGEVSYLFTQDYFLWLEADKKQQKLTSVYPKGMDESLTIVWAGDLDSDIRVDLIINDNSEFNFFRICF